MDASTCSHCSVFPFWACACSKSSPQSLVALRWPWMGKSNLQRPCDSWLYVGNGTCMVLFDRSWQSCQVAGPKQWPRRAGSHLQRVTWKHMGRRRNEISFGVVQSTESEGLSSDWGWWAFHVCIFPRGFNPFAGTRSGVVVCNPSGIHSA